MAKIKFNDGNIRAIQPPKTGHRIDYALEDVPGFAVQTVYTGSKTFLACYVAKQTGKERRMPIGPYGPSPGLSVAAARARAKQVRAIVELGGDPWQTASDQRAAAEAREKGSANTLGDLCLAYSESLRRGNKPSAPQVERELRATVEKPCNKVWRTPAAQLTIDELVAPMNRLVRAGKWRQAEKTRSYLRAAFNAAASARGKASASDLFAAFAGIANLARDLSPIERPKSHDEPKRALTQAELTAYYRRIQGPEHALLRVHLLMGAQRCAQLSRVTWRHVEGDAVTLLDSKGRRKKARTHVIPLLPEAAEALEQLRGSNGPFAFSHDGGKTGAGFHAVRRKVEAVAEAMVRAGEVASPFTPGELRITVETRLAAAGVPLEVRAQLQSHGLGGVQHRHYDKHDYYGEKRAALETLLTLLRDEAGNVVPFPHWRRTA